MPTPTPRIPGFVIGGTGSSAGKTTFTLALLCALHQRGLAARAAKNGPDYIDAAFHAALTGQPAANLDAWMCREAAPSPNQRPLSAGATLPAGLRRVFARMAAPVAAPVSGEKKQSPDVLVVEGAMGLFDGGHRGAGSTAHLAALLDLPVLLVLHAGGMGQSIAALAEGFLRHSPPWARTLPVKFLGMVCTHVGSPRHAELLQQALAPLVRSSGVPLLGLLPRQGAPELPSRHLGLVEAREALPGVDRAALARWIEEHCNVDRLLSRAGAAHRRIPASAASLETASQPEQHFFPPAAPAGHTRARTRIGMAWDEAFSFCYADLPALLHECGAEVVMFSPLHDAAPPANCNGLYFPGGYPELHAARLAANASMRENLHVLASRGVRIYGECGGYMYLMRSLRVDGQEYAMSGLLPRTCALETDKAALGYRAALAVDNWPYANGSIPETGHPKQQPSNRPLWVRGHEFHYAREDASPLSQGCSPIWKLHDSQGRFLHDEGCRLGTVAGSWLHCYPEGARRFWRMWVQNLRR